MAQALTHRQEALAVALARIPTPTLKQAASDAGLCYTHASEIRSKPNLVNAVNLARAEQADRGKGILRKAHETAERAARIVDRAYRAMEASGDADPQMAVGCLVAALEATKRALELQEAMPDQTTPADRIGQTAAYGRRRFELGRRYRDRELRKQRIAASADIADNEAQCPPCDVVVP